MNIPKPIYTPVGNCHHCGKNARYNTPGLDPSGNLWCNDCVIKDRSDIGFLYINQNLENGKYVYTEGVSLNGVSVRKDKYAWTDGGRHSVKLTEEELKLSPKEIANIINQEHNIDKLTRCSDCGIKMKFDEIAGYPLFAGVNCKPCFEKHLKATKFQRQTGQVCGLCHKPYNDCYC